MARASAATRKRRKTKAGKALYRPIAALAVLWNSIGLSYWAMRRFIDADAFMGLPALHQQYLSAMPLWAWSACAVAVLFGVVGALALLWGSQIAVPLSAWACMGAMAFLAYPLSYWQDYSPDAWPLIYTPCCAAGLTLLQLGYALYGRKQGYLR
jgi:hypothetical protein